jgi:amino acid efflux transporter
VLYLGLATTSVLVLGPATGRSQAPLSDLMAIALGEQARIVTAVVAVLLTVGAMNAYYAGGSRLGAALARDGALPRWLARGAEAGQVPRPSIALVTASSMLSLVVAVVLDLGLTPLMLLATGCFTLVYVLGTASALRLLPRGTRGWWTALVAHASVVTLLLVNGIHALWALGLVLLSLAYQSRTRR